jgi:hypothetical protein
MLSRSWRSVPLASSRNLAVISKTFSATADHLSRAAA